MREIVVGLAFQLPRELIKVAQGPVEIYTDWVLAFIIDKLDIDRAVYLRYDKEYDRWILIAEKNLVGVGGISGEYPYSDMPPRDSFCRIGEWYPSPKDDIGFDAIFVFEAGEHLWALALDDTTQAKTFSSSLLENVSGYFVEAMKFKRKIDNEKERASMDALTSLKNRRTWEERIWDIQNDCWICSIDLDHFKKINDELGHSVGDQVLKFFGKLLLEFSGEFFRVGGEEFSGIILDDEASVREGLEDLLLRLKAEKICPWPVTFSAGICRLPKGGDVRLASRAADLACYYQKAHGRDGICSATIPSLGVDIVGKTNQELFDLFGIVGAE